MRPYFLVSERLGFSKWSESDLDLALGLWGDHEVTRLIDVRGKLNEEQVREKLLKEIDNERRFGVQYWPIFLLGSEEHVGCCGLRPYDLSKGIYETGFHIRSSFWGHGLAKEAVCGVIKYAFEEMKVKGLFAGHNPNNGASRSLLDKLGFRYTHDEFYAPTGLYHPSYILEAETYEELFAGTL